MVSARTGSPNVSVMGLGGTSTLLCNFCLSVAPRIIFWAHPSLRYTLTQSNTETIRPGASLTMADGCQKLSLPTSILTTETNKQHKTNKRMRKQEKKKRKNGKRRRRKGKKRKKKEKRNDDGTQQIPVESNV